MDADGSHQLHDLGRPLPSVRTELALDVLRLLYHSLEDENVARPPMMVGEIDVHPHPDEFPALGREVAQMLRSKPECSRGSMPAKSQTSTACSTARMTPPSDHRGTRRWLGHRRTRLHERRNRRSSAPRTRYGLAAPNQHSYEARRSSHQKGAHRK
jgi:hypothetical protein